MEDFEQRSNPKNRIVWIVWIIWTKWTEVFWKVIYNFGAILIANFDYQRNVFVP